MALNETRPEKSFPVEAASLTPFRGIGFFFVVFASATLLIAVMSVDLLFGITRVRAERGRIQVRHGPFGIGPTWTFDLREIERIRVVPGGSTGRHASSRIRIERRPRRRGEGAWWRNVIAGQRVPAAEAEALAQAMRESVGL